MSVPSLPESLVRELIQRHARSQTHRQPFDPDSPAAEVTNPVCGDVVRVQVVCAEDRIREVRLGGHGCTLSQAAASMVADRIIDRSWDDVGSMEAAFASMIRDGDPSQAELGDLRALAGVGRFPNRIRCSRLIWEALQQLNPTM